MVALIVTLAKFSHAIHVVHTFEAQRSLWLRYPGLLTALIISMCGAAPTTTTTGCRRPSAHPFMFVCLCCCVAVIALVVAAFGLLVALCVRRRCRFRIRFCRRRTAAAAAAAAAAADDDKPKSE